jgi:hypothetical protein
MTDLRGHERRREGGLLPLAALSAALLIGGLGAAIPKVAPAGDRAGETHADLLGSGLPTRRPASFAPLSLPPATPPAAHSLRVGGRE